MKLNIGGQKKRRKGPFKDWTIVDVSDGAEIKMDVMDAPLPIVSNTADIVYTSHTLEHIFPDRLPFVLSECYRVLKPEHAIRVVVPDIDIAIQAYLRKDTVLLGDKKSPRKLSVLPALPLCYLASWFFTYKLEVEGSARLTGGHVMAFNFEVLEHYLKKAGFKNIEQKSYNKCRPEFVGCDFERHKDYSLYVEASR